MPHTPVRSPQIIYTLSDIFRDKATHTRTFTSNYLHFVRYLQRQSHTYPYVHLKLSTLCQISSETKPHTPVRSPQIIYTLSDIFRDKATHTRTFTSNYLHFVRYLRRQSHTHPYVHLKLSTLCQISSETKPHTPVRSPQIIYTLSDIFIDKATHTRTFTSNYLHFVRYLQRQSHTYPYVHLKLSTLCQISSETKPHIPVHSSQIIYRHNPPPLPHPPYIHLRLSTLCQMSSDTRPHIPVHSPQMIYTLSDIFRLRRRLHYYFKGTVPKLCNIRVQELCESRGPR